MALAVAANTGCNLTMVGTPPNMLANAALENAGFAPFGFFEFAIIGAPLCLGCLIYTVYLAPKILPKNQAKMMGIAQMKIPGRYAVRYRLCLSWQWWWQDSSLAFPGYPPP